MKNLNICLLFIILNCFIFNYSFANTLTGYGKYITDDKLKKIEIGISKYKLYDLLGSPTFIFKQELDHLCYYYFNNKKNKYFKIERRCIIFFFDKDILKYYKVFLY